MDLYIFSPQSIFPALPECHRLLPGQKCDFHLLLLASVISLMRTVETEECAMPLAALWAPGFRWFVLLVLKSESCFLPLENDNLSALPPYA